MAPKKSQPEVLGEVTPPGADRSPTSGHTDKKKDDTTPTPVVDKDVTPSGSEDDKKKKDSSTSQKKGSSLSGTSHNSQHTELTELSPGGVGQGLLKQKEMAGSRMGRGVAAASRKKMRKQNSIFNKKLKQLRKSQVKRQKHPRSFCGNIMHILKSVNETQEQDILTEKRAGGLAMMIFDSFANDLCDKVIAASVELTKNTGKRQLGSSEVKTAMKLVLPSDMAVCAEEAVEASLVAYRDSTKRMGDGIAKAKDAKKAATGKTEKEK